MDKLADGEPAAQARLAERVRRLSPGQLECLRLVAEHLSSKEIAAMLGISPHTVDQRIRGALQVLQVERRTQAARIIATINPEYQRLIHQSPLIEGQAGGGNQGGAVGIQIRHIDRAGEAGPTDLNSERSADRSWSSLPLPFATRSNPRNEMSIGARLVWIVIIAIGAAFSAGMYLAGLESLSRMLGQ